MFCNSGREVISKVEVPLEFRRRFSVKTVLSVYLQVHKSVHDPPLLYSLKSQERATWSLPGTAVLSPAEPKQVVGLPPAQSWSLHSFLPSERDTRAQSSWNGS